MGCHPFRDERDRVIDGLNPRGKISHRRDRCEFGFMFGQAQFPVRWKHYRSIMYYRFYRLYIRQFTRNESVLTVRWLIFKKRKTQWASYAFGPQGSGPDPAASRDENDTRARFSIAERSGSPRFPPGHTFHVRNRYHQINPDTSSLIAPRSCRLIGRPITRNSTGNSRVFRESDRASLAEVKNGTRSREHSLLRAQKPPPWRRRRFLNFQTFPGRCNCCSS